MRCCNGACVAHCLLPLASPGANCGPSRTCFKKEDYGIKLFIGLDVSLAKTAICVISEHGKIQKEAEVASDQDALCRWIGEQNGTIAAIGLEASPLLQWLHRCLTEAGFETVLMETRQVKGALKAMPIKTDSRDARVLHDFCTWAGFGQFTANRYRRKRCVQCSAPESPFSRA